MSGETSGTSSCQSRQCCLSAPAGQPVPPCDQTSTTSSTDTKTAPATGTRIPERDVVCMLVTDKNHEVTTVHLPMFMLQERLPYLLCKAKELGMTLSFP